MRDLLQKRAALEAEMTALAAKGLNISADEEKRFGDVEAEIGRVDAAIKRLEKTQGFEPTPPVDGDVTQETRNNTGKPFAALGEQLLAVAKSTGQNAQVDRRLYAVKAALTGLNETVPADGGFLVQTDFATELLKMTYETGILASRTQGLPLSANANGVTINANAETSRATGSRWGGIRGYWAGEGGTKTPSRPTFRQISLKLKKLVGLCWATDELLQDATALGSYIMQGFAEEFGWLVDDAIYRGDGVGKPLGVLNSGALVTVAAEAGQPAATIVKANIDKMWSRMLARARANAIWVINQDVEPQLDSLSQVVGVAGVPVYMPPGGIADTPYARLKGRPVVVIEQASTLGTVGDISLIDLSYFLMIDKGGMQSASSIHVHFDTDETVFRFVYRTDGQPQLAAPITPANGTNTLSPFVTLATR